MKNTPNGAAEWLESDGVGGYASGTVSTIRSRRYQGLRVTATTPPTGRMVLVSGFEAWVEGPGGREALTSERYAPDVVNPDGHRRVAAFSLSPWPTWTYQLESGAQVRAEILATPPHARTLVRWTLMSPTAPLTLRVLPFLAVRDYHGMQHQNDAARMTPSPIAGGQSWRLYNHSPEVVSLHNGQWQDEPQWFREFLYSGEQERGLDAVEDLSSGGVISFNLADGPAVWVVGSPEAMTDLAVDRLAADVDTAIVAERARREALGGTLERAADQYIVRRGIGRTIVAGYPWFTDWGRDTFISMRGLCLATGRLDTARDILLEWTDVISRGMLPNRFADGADPPEYNSVDASLWFMVVAEELLQHPDADAVLTAQDRARLETAIVTILEGLARGTRYGIRCDDDGLLAAGEPGVQLTWMDARVGDRVITPRIGKPVEIQALWINALTAGARISARWPGILAQARAAFDARFWNEAEGCLFDVVDVDHHRGAVDGSIRPNQILVVGGLPVAILNGDRARRIVERVERDLLTPIGLRSLAPGDPQYAGHYQGGPSERDAVYHQGTVWPWLIAAFVDAWLRVHGDAAATREEARTRFLAPLIAHLDDAGLGHVSEIADADAPHHPRGCPFQAWSVGELIRMDRHLR